MTADALALLPPTIRELIEAGALDLDGALALVRARGGQAVYVPAELPAGHWLTELLGAQAGALAAYIGGGFLDVPRCARLLQAARDARIVADSTTLTRNQVAAMHGITWRAVAMAKARHRDRADDLSPAPGDLFADWSPR